MADREYDFIIYGASGFTGEYVVQEMYEVTKDSNYKWAVAGRNEKKLEQTLVDASQVLDKDLTHIPILIADSSDEQSLVELAQKTKVLLNCVGPYRLYGEPVVKACVENGAHYVDISGEFTFLESMQAKYHEIAETKGVYIVGACGFDSIPCAMGLKFTKNNIKGDIHSINTVLQMKPGSDGYVLNTGTYQTLVLTLGGNDDLKSIRDKIMPKKMPEITPKPINKTFLYKNDKMDGTWCLPFDTDGSEITRTMYHNFNERNERPFHVQQSLAFTGIFSAIGVVLLGIFWALMAQLKFTLNILQKYPEICSFGLFSSQGPTRSQTKNTSFTIWFFGRGWSDKLNSDQQHENEPTEEVTVRCDGPDPGYYCTSTCLVAAAMTIKQESDKMPSNGGVYSAGAAFEETNLIKRLEDRNLTFKVQ